MSFRPRRCRELSQPISIWKGCVLMSALQFSVHALHESWVIREGQEVIQGLWMHGLLHKLLLKGLCLNKAPKHQRVLHSEFRLCFELLVQIEPLWLLLSFHDVGVIQLCKGLAVCGEEVVNKVVALRSHQSDHLVLSGHDLRNTGNIPRLGVAKTRGLTQNG